MKVATVTLFVVSFISVFLYVACQQAGTVTAEVHPPLTTYTCTSAGCVSQAQSITLDAGWRWIHTTTGYDNCYSGSGWDETLCPDPVTCATGCALDGAAYSSTYGITTNGTSISLQLVTGSNVGSRVYLLKDDNNYQLLHLKNREITFDVDVASLPCGLNGALYLVEMPGDGGKAAYPTNQAGATFGTGYCDAQCPQDVKFINGQANLLNWTASNTGFYGSCCTEMDLWEANTISTAYTPHPCDTVGLYRCNGTSCGSGSDRFNGVCDKDGCDFNSYRQGNTTFYGPGSTVDTTKPITVVTQFITVDGTDTGALSEIKRVYVQNGVIIPNSQSNWPNLSPYSSITDQYCTDQKTLFDNPQQFIPKGGVAAMGEALDRGVVLVMSLWDDSSSYMLWLDSVYPSDASASTPGVVRGSCAITSGVPKDVESSYGSSTITWSNLKWGTIGSTYGTSPSSSSGTAASTSTAGGTTSSASSSAPTTTGGDVIVTSTASSAVVVVCWFAVLVLVVLAMM